jgi:hypothetical protein
MVRAFPTRSHRERGLLVDSLIASVVAKNKEVAVELTPPLAGLGFLSTAIAHRRGKPQVCELQLRVEDILDAFYGSRGPRGDNAEGRRGTVER